MKNFLIEFCKQFAPALIIAGLLEYLTYAHCEDLIFYFIPPLFIIVCGVLFYFYSYKPNEK